MKHTAHTSDLDGSVKIIGREWRSELCFAGHPFIHIAFGLGEDRKRLTARGLIAVGQYAQGFISIGQFCVGVLTISQFSLSLFSLSQFTIAAFGLAQFGAFIDGVAQYCLRLVDFL